MVKITRIGLGVSLTYACVVACALAAQFGRCLFTFNDTTCVATRDDTVRTLFDQYHRGRPYTPSRLRP